MLFNYYEFKQDLLENPDKTEFIRDFIDSFGDNEKIENEIFYKEYLSLFEPVVYNIPEELKDDFDFPLLFRLIAASFSSQYALNFPDSEKSLPELVISVKSGDAAIVKMVSELWSFQILRLFEIYCEEMINLENCRNSDPIEMASVLQERETRVTDYNKKIEGLEYILNYFDQSNILKEKMASLLGSFKTNL
jgi:antitoxin component HigA of HigAB toxin-antitoxin module